MKTTPKPNATKKSRGELGPLPPLSAVLVAAAPEEVAEAKAELLAVAILGVLECTVLLSAAYVEANDILGQPDAQAFMCQLLLPLLWSLQSDGNSILLLSSILRIMMLLSWHTDIVRIGFGFRRWSRAGPETGARVCFKGGQTCFRESSQIGRLLNERITRAS